MPQLVVPAGTNLRIQNVDVNGMLTSRSHRRLEASSKFPDDLQEIVRNVRNQVAWLS